VAVGNKHGFVEEHHDSEKEEKGAYIRFETYPLLVSIN